MDGNRNVTAQPERMSGIERRRTTIFFALELKTSLRPAGLSSRGGYRFGAAGNRTGGARAAYPAAFRRTFIQSTAGTSTGIGCSAACYVEAGRRHMRGGRTQRSPRLTVRVALTPRKPLLIVKRESSTFSRSGSKQSAVSTQAGSEVGVKPRCVSLGSIMWIGGKAGTCATHRRQLRHHAARARRLYACRVLDHNTTFRCKPQKNVGVRLALPKAPSANIDLEDFEPTLAGTKTDHLHGLGWHCARPRAPPSSGNSSARP